MKITHLFSLLIVGGIVGWSPSTLFSTETPSEIGQVLEINGANAELKYIRDKESGFLTVQDPLFVKDIVMTGVSTKARLHLTPDTESSVDLFLNENSNLTLDGFVLNPDGHKDLMTRLSEGVLKVIAKGFSQKKRLLIHTPNGVIGIRGTIGWFWFFKNRFGCPFTGAYIIKGKAFIAPKDENGNIVSSKKESCQEKVLNVLDSIGTNKSMESFDSGFDIEKYQKRYYNTPCVDVDLVDSILGKEEKGKLKSPYDPTQDRIDRTREIPRAEPPTGTSGSAGEGPTNPGEGSGGGGGGGGSD